MTEQKVYQKILRKIIDQTNNDQIATSQQLLDKLVNELVRHDALVKPHLQSKDKMFG